MTLEGKVAIVTGGGRNIGRQTCLLLAEHAARVAVVAGSSREQAVAVVEEIRQAGGEAEPFTVDIRERADVERLVAEVVKTWGRVDILVNNAAARQHADFVHITDDVWNHSLAVNLTGPFYLCQAAARSMLDQGAGSIINVSGSVVYVGGAGHVAVAAAKAGLQGLTRSLATELASAGVRANIVVPHVIDTEREVPFPPEVLERWLSEIPMHRFGSVDDVANACLFLASDASSYLTGQTIHVNGGRVMVA